MSGYSSALVIDMAKITMSGLDEYAKKIAQLGVRAEGVIKYAVYPGAAIVIEAIKANTPVSYPDGGDLKNSTYLKTFVNKNGFIYTQVGWDGYDRKGVPNALKANALESGTSKMPKRLFVRPAVNKVKRAAEFAIEQALNQKINEIMK